MGAGASDIAQVVPELRERLPDLPSPLRLEGEQERFRFFDSAVRFFRSAAKARPLVIVLDDLHSADLPTLLLLEFLVREIKDAPVLVVGIYREVEAELNIDVTRVLGEIARDSEVIPLGGLSEPDVGEFIEARLGRSLDAGARASAARRWSPSVHRATGGNPFFAREIVRLLAAEGKEDAAIDSFQIPVQVREAIHRRLVPLRNETRRLLRVAAVIGKEFDVGVLQRACDATVEQVLDAIDETVLHNLLSPLSSERGRYSFSHSLVRDVLYDDLPSAERGRMHHRVGEALEAVHETSLQSCLFELAQHFSLAHYLGILATTLSEFEAAEAHFETALQMEAEMGARPYMALTRYEYARMLFGQPNADQRGRAPALLGEALREAQEMGMQGLVEKARALMAGEEYAQGVRERELAKSREPTREAVFRLEKDYWTIGEHPQLMRLKSTKGLEYIHYLLRHPGYEFHVLQLTRLVTPALGQHPFKSPSREDLSGMSLQGDIGPLFGHQATAAYTSRLIDLRDEIEQAKEHNDLGRAEKLQAEMDFLTHELAMAVGLSRRRTAGSVAERARVNVTKLITTAKKQIRDGNPALGRYLAKTIKTGTFCSYQPDPDVPIRWQL
jgi:hypothetical protein